MTDTSVPKILPHMPPKRLAAWLRNDGLPVTGERYEVRDHTVAGHVLRVGASGAISYWHYYTNSNGKRCKFKLGDAAKMTLAQARTACGKSTLAVEGGRDPEAERRTSRIESKNAVSRTLDAFLTNEYAPRYLAHRKTGDATEARIRNAWKPFLERDMATLTRGAADRHRSERLKGGKMPSTLNRDRVALLGLLNKAVEWGGLDSNPLAGWKPLKLAEDDRVRFLDDGERKRFMSALDAKATSTYLRELVKLALLTGMRRGELFDLTWGDLSLERQQLTVRAANAKTGTGRVVQLPPSAVTLLKARKARLAAIPLPAVLVFPSPVTGGRMDNIKRGWRTLCKRAQVDGFRFHDCRHDYASRLVMAGTDLYTVQRLLGHSDIQMTQRYAHLSPDHLRSAVEVLG